VVETADMAELIKACVEWARERDAQVDPDSLKVILRIHRDERRQPDPCCWSRNDVDLVAAELRRSATDFAPDALITSWLTWCDFLVETERLVPRGVGPRDLRAAVEGVAELLRRRLDPVPVELARAALEAGASEATSALSPVRLPPIAELAGAARKVASLHAAKELALWIGDRRPLAADRDKLTDDDAAVAAAELGIAPADLALRFDTAVNAGFLRLTYTHVLPGPALPDWPDGDDEAALRVWCDALDIATFLPQAPMSATLLQTHLFAHQAAAMPVEELGRRYEELLSGYHADDPDADHPDADAVMAALERLAAYGAVELTDDEARATSLGDYAVIQRLQRSGQLVKVVTDAAQMSAEELLAALVEVRVADIDPLVSDWFDVREPLDGARELLAACVAPEAYVVRCLAPLWSRILAHQQFRRGRSGWIIRR
jgi:hypothetical protein